MWLHFASTSRQASRRYRITVWIGAATLILGIMLASAFALYQLRTYALEQAALVAKNLALSVEQTFNGLIGSVHNSLYASGDEISRQMATGRLYAPAVNQYLKRQATRVPHIHAIRSTNEWGDTLYGSDASLEGINIADREYFRTLQNDSTKELMVSKAVLSRSTHEWMWVFASRVNQDDPTFRGIIFADLKLSNIDRMLEKIQAGGGTGNVIAIRDDELLLVARNAIGATNTVKPGIKGLSEELSQALKTDRNSGNYIGGLTSVDGIQRVYFYTRNPTYGFLTIVGVSVDTALADWWHEVWVFLFFLLAVTGLIYAFARHLSQALDRQETDFAKLAAEQNQSHTLEFYDSLTGLPNRRLLMDRLTQALASCLRTGKQGALLFIDLDNFKTLNDSLGHDFGDMLLKQVSQRLLRCLRQVDTVARAGGDEFVIVLQNFDEHGSQTAMEAERIGKQILAELNQPYQLGVHPYSSSASIGITIFDNHGQSVEDLLKQADIAMYQAKQAGRNCVRFLDPKIQERIAQRAYLEMELHSALEHQQFELYYQIQVNQSGKPTGAEALIRWIHPERGVIGPAHFIPVAEDSGLILLIGNWVLETACRQIRTWQESPATRELIIAVNVSARQFCELDFVAQVHTIITRHSIPANRLEIELTEGVMLDDIDDAIKKMQALKALGVQFSLDDFGTGYSSLQYLKMLPLDQLKIDQSFVRNLVLDSNDQVIVDTIIAMAKALNLGVIAEGVETLEQKQFLVDHGCTHLQGYLFGKPVPIKQFEALIAGC